MTIRRPAIVALLALAAVGCSQAEPPNPLADRGRKVYLSQCTQCHAMDPALPGPVGPPVKGASAALLEARILRAEYPPGYQPKQSTRVMQPQPELEPDIPALAEYLK